MVSRPPSVRTTASDSPSGAQSADRTFSSTSRGAPPPIGTRASTASLPGRSSRTAISPWRDTAWRSAFEAERPRLRAAWLRGVDLEGAALQVGGVDDRASVGREPRVADGAAPEGERLEGRSRRTATVDRPARNSAAPAAAASAASAASRSQRLARERRARRPRPGSKGRTAIRCRTRCRGPTGSAPPGSSRGSAGRSGRGRAAAAGPGRRPAPGPP